jgi:hypothetical protein
MSTLDGDSVSALLNELGERLAARGIEGEIYVVGGAAMMLAYDPKRITRDIDAVGNPQEDIDAEVRAMALQRPDLGPDWLNNRVLPLLPRGIHADQLQLLGGPGLTVNVASPRWMLALKARAARGRRDLDDLWVLCQVLELRSINEVWRICNEVWGDAMVREDVLEIVGQDLIARGLRDY